MRGRALIGRFFEYPAGSVASHQPRPRGSHVAAVGAHAARVAGRAAERAQTRSRASASVQGNAARHIGKAASPTQGRQ